ncbi:hypothetical protein U91I_03702 [alpha proteobacterium U9-1i]|nr:hypothetical protein U91I_03702 [alpha proteobacterium U9-1i]
MWRAGFDLALLAWSLNAIALLAGVCLGARALVDPRWAARFVRLKPDERGGGFAEFRATYGGVFAASHAAALLITLKWILGGEFIFGLYAAGAAAVLAAAWAGACGGRALSMWRDATRTRWNMLSACAEAGMALAIAAPWFLWSFKPPG